MAYRMIPLVRHRACVRVTATTFSLPSFLTPSCVPATRSFSTSTNRASYIGAAPITIPQGVTFTLVQPEAQKKKPQPLRFVEVEGPLGKMTQELAPFVEVAYDEPQGKVTVNVRDKSSPHERSMWGTTRAHIQNHILGVSEGHTAILSLVGVGYRASLEAKATTVQPAFTGQQIVNLKVGFSHPIELLVPEGVKASVPQPTRILLESIDKLKVGQFAADIRKWRVPEPYKGKGIFVNGETARMKAKKIS